MRRLISHQKEILPCLTAFQVSLWVTIGLASYPLFCPSTQSVSTLSLCSLSFQGRRVQLHNHELDACRMALTSSSTGMLVALHTSFMVSKLVWHLLQGWLLWWNHPSSEKCASSLFSHNSTGGHQPLLWTVGGRMQSKWQDLVHIKFPFPLQC